MLAADPSAKEMFGPVAGNVTGATLKPEAVLLPRGLNMSEEQTFFCAFLNIYLQGEVELRDGGAGGEESNGEGWCSLFHLRGGDAVHLCRTGVAGAHCLPEPPRVLQLCGVSRDPAPPPRGMGLPGAFNTGH